jgi:hypothetical protein
MNTNSSAVEVSKATEKKRCSSFCVIGNARIQCVQLEDHYGYCLAFVTCEKSGKEVSVMFGTPKHYIIPDDYEPPF